MDSSVVLANLSESKNTQFGRMDFDKQTKVQKVFSAIWSLHSDVANGGFCQYFENYSGQMAGFVLEALTEIGADQIAEIVREAIRTAFPHGLPEDCEQIASIARDGFPELTITRLNELDDRFYKCKQDHCDLLLEFVRKHPEEFGDIEKVN